MFLLRESQWKRVLDSPIKLRQSNITSFDECFTNYECASDLVNAYTLLKFLSNDPNLSRITCADVAIYNQFGVHGNETTTVQHDKIDQYAAVLNTHQCMNKTLTNFQTKLMINKLKLPEKQHLMNVSIVPRRCLDCIRTANNYNSENSNRHCLDPVHKFPNQKCGSYGINFEYFLQVNGNQVTKLLLPEFYNQTSELENQHHLLDTVDLLNKLTNVDGNKQFRNEFDFKEEDDYDKKLTQLLDLDYVPVAKSIKEFRRPKRKNSKLLNRLVNRATKSRRNSKFSKESNVDEEATSILQQSVQKLIGSSSYQNFAHCATNLRCSEQLINIYVKQHLVDCNLDSTIDCDDFASIHWLGKRCTFLKQNTMLYSNLWKNFEYCSILADDVRKEEMEGNDKNYYNYDLPSFQVRPNLTSTPSQANQYYSINFVDLSTDCLQCICEASSDHYNCTQILTSHYSSAYYSAAVQPQPPRIVYLKTNNRMPKDDQLDEEKSDYNPFSITKLHFLESMINTFWYKGAAGDWERCAESIECSIEAVSKYVTRFSMDCTKDGRLSCADFGLIHRFKDKCADLNVLNTDYYRKFEKCLIKFGLH